MHALPRDDVPTFIRVSNTIARVTGGTGGRCPSPFTRHVVEIQNLLQAQTEDKIKGHPYHPQNA
jgi:hypothetical protein